LDQLTPRIIAGPANGAIVTWDDYRDYNADIYAQQVNGAGAILWTANGVGVCTDLAEQYGTNPVSDDAGGVIVPWNDFRNNSGDVLLQRITAAGAVAPGWPVNGKAACTVSGNQFDPVAVSDDAGGVILSWDDFRITRPSYEIYAQRITGTGSVAQGWPSQGQLVCGAANDQLQPAIAPDLAGGAIVAWYDYRSGPADIYAYRVMASGGSSTVDVPPMEPTDLGLVQAFPNPMRVRTEIRLRLTAGEHVTLDVVDLAGRRIRSLADDQWLDAGVHAYGWDGRDVSGSRAPGGVYLIAVRAGNRFAVRKLALID
jgi:hypothetical protein